MADQPVTYHLRQRLPSRSGMGWRQQADEAEHAGDLRRTLPSSTSTAVLVALFPTLGDMGRRCWHRVLVELQQQRSDPGYQCISAQERGCLIGERSWVGLLRRDASAVVNSLWSTAGSVPGQHRRRRAAPVEDSGCARKGTSQARIASGADASTLLVQASSISRAATRVSSVCQGEWGFAGTPQSLLQRPLSGMGPEPRRYTEGLDGWCFWYGRHLGKARQGQGLVAL